uniref:F-box/LRR-repeat protein 2 n=1 Tax=Schistosoma haematobium TaxID=6185 RepID=A0A094ZGI4_SCHHA
MVRSWLMERCFTELCHMIESLDLSGCQNLTNGTCDYLGKNCSLLTTLSLESCSRIDDAGLEMLSWCSNLTCLDVSWCSVGDRGLTAIARGCKNLQRFRAIGCQEITSRGVEQLARHCHGLLLLNLNYCGQGVTDEAMVHLSIGCPDLRVLAVSHCSITDQGLRAIAGTLSPAAAAAIVGQATSTSQQNGIPLILPVVTSNGSVNNQDASSPNGNVNNHGDRDNNRRQKTDDSNKITLIPVGCVSLTTLEVARCSAITDIGLSAIARLEKLDLEDCALVTDSTLAQLAVHCPRLNTLVLSHCDQVTDEGIARLAEGLCGPDQLQTLAMDNCPLLTDAALEHLGSNCRKLRQLDLYDCQLITKQGINSLELHYPQLQIHAYFAPGTPPALTFARRRRYCRCCRII